MTGFKTALTSEKGSTITDGTYVFKDNAGANGTTGIYLAGTVRGSSDKGSLTITANDRCDTDFYAPGITFENCTVEVASKTRTWLDQRDLNLKNASLKVSNFGQGYYVNTLNMESSSLVIGDAGYGSTGMYVGSAKPSTISNSTISSALGYNAGISVGGGGTISVTNSTLEFTNGGTGGLNVNTGRVVLTNSTIKGDGGNSGALFGAQTNGSIEFKEDCLVETPAASDADNGAGQTKNNYIVTGGSHLVKYAPSYNSSFGSTIPTNGAANGDEKLSLFTLADSSTAALNPLNLNGETYSYSVAKASSDGEKHVWVPAAKVTFKLNADDAAEQVSASYADGSTADQTSLAMRGYALKDASSMAGGSTALPDDPFAAGYKFLGWFYKDAAGAEQPFSESDSITSNLTVYAKWDADASSYAVKYHNDAPTDVTYLSTSSDPARSIKVLSGDDVMKANPSFSIEGKTFKGWTTQPDGAGDEVAAGSMLVVPVGANVVDLYAKWEDKEVTVKFSANGGVFTDDSVFKKNPDVFDIATDENGGEVAVVKKQPKATDKVTLDALLASLGNGSVSASAPGIKNPAGTDSDAAYTNIATYKYHVLGNEAVELSFLGFVYGHEYYYWFNDAAGSSKATIDGREKLTQDVTYYLKWDDDPAVEHVEGTSSLPSDMWSGSQAKTASIKEVSTDEAFSMTGAIDASGIVGQMDALESSIAGGLDDLTKISLSDTTSTFTATVTLPDGVVVPSNPTVTVTGLGDCFEVADTTVNGQDVTMTFSLKQGLENYRQLKDAVESTGKDDAPTAAITKPIAVTVDGLTLDADNVTNGQELTATGVVSGTFSSYAENTVTGKAKKFDYAWNGEQIAASADPRGADIRQTLLVVKPISQTLPADILVGNDTEHDVVYPVLPGQTIDFTGAIEASVVKSQMRGIESQFPGTTDYAGIRLTDMSSSFTATFTIPDGLTLPENLSKDSVRLEGFSDTFSVTDLSVSGKTVTATMTLKDGIETYKDLQEAVIDNLADTMSVTIPGVKIDDDFPAGDTATVSGTVGGDFNAHATKTATGTTKVFSFMWEGEQKPEGMDATAGSVDDGILFTVAAASPLESALPGDMLVGANTEHDAVIESAQGSTFDLTGAILAASIQEQMDKIEAAYPNANHDGIALDNLSFSFVATFTVPDGMTLPSDLDASKVTAVDFGDGFKVSDVQASGKTVTVTFALSDPSSVKSYSDLEEVVDGAGATDGWMKLTVPGIKIDDDAKVGSNLTITGTVTGSFSAAATSEAGTRKVFSFTWDAAQWPDGKDAVATDDDTISLTVKVTKGEEPSTPGNPQANAQPTSPSGTGTPGTRSWHKGLVDTGDSILVPATLGGMALLAVVLLGIAIILRRRSHD